MKRIVSIILVISLFSLNLYCQRTSLGILIAPTIKNYELIKVDSILNNPTKLSRNYVRFGGNWNVTLFENLQLLLEPQLEYNINQHKIMGMDIPLVARVRFGKNIKFVTDFGMTVTPWVNLSGSTGDSKLGYLYGGGVEYKVKEKVSIVWILRHSRYTYENIKVDNSQYSLDVNQFTFNFCIQLKP